MNYIIIEQDNSQILATHLYGYIIVFKGFELNNLGLMKQYIDSLSKILHEIFKPFEEILKDKNENSQDEVQAK